MNNRVTIVNAGLRDWLGRRYYGDVVFGTIHSYYPSSNVRLRAWTAAGAKRRGDRVIRRMARRAEKRARRERAARQATGYDTGRE